jgi:hypothetical protein
MRYRSMLLLVVGAVALGVLSWFLPTASARSDGLLFAWFYWLPGIVSAWLRPEADATFILLSMAVYSVQYLLVFSAGALAMRGARILVAQVTEAGKV